MKQVLSLFAILTFFFIGTTNLFAEQEIIDWQGSEEGVEESPAWLDKYLNGKGEKALRTFFSLAKGDRFFLGIGKDSDLDIAKEKAKKNVMEKASSSMLKEIGKKEIYPVLLNGIEHRWTFWQELSAENNLPEVQKIKNIFTEEELDEESVFKAYCLYSISNQNWEKLKELNKGQL